MQIRSEIAFFTASHHGCDDLLANHNTPDIFAVRFFDKLLNQDVGVCAAKGLDNTFCRFGRFTQHDADALGAFQQLNDNWCTAGDVQKLRCIRSPMRKYGGR